MMRSAVSLRGRRVPIPVKILVVGTIALVMLTLAILLSANALVKAVAYKEIAKEVQVGQRTLWYLVNERGSAHIDAAGDLRFGSWRVSGDHSVVDRVRLLTGVEATIFALRDGRPIRVTTTIRKLNSTERNDNTELIGPARVAFDRGLSFTGVSPVAGQTYINRYEPLKDPSGKTIGIIYTGEPVSAMVQAMSDAPRFVLITAVCGLVLLVGLLLVASRNLWSAVNDVSGAISTLVFEEIAMLTQTMKGLAGGDLTGSFSSSREPLKVNRNDEIGDLLTTYNTLVAALHEMGNQYAVATGNLRHLVSCVARTSTSLHLASENRWRRPRNRRSASLRSPKSSTSWRTAIGTRLRISARRRSYSRSWVAPPIRSPRSQRIRRGQSLKPRAHLKSSMPASVHCRLEERR